ncbi:MAG: flagellar motor switch protein FliN [Spirochaetes bacterium]|nr:flagellar motor switch protein FliN [Spirochaetota bacterium]
MGDGSLSQEEIDALLQGADDLGAAIETPAAPEAPAGVGIREFGDSEKSKLVEFAREAAQSMGITLSTVTAKKVEMTNPRVEVTDAATLVSQYSGRLVQIAADYSEGISGKHSFIIGEDTAKQMAALMMAQDEGDLTEMSLQALTEGFSQMSGAAVNAIEEKVKNSVKTAGLEAVIQEDPAGIDAPQGDFVRIRYDIKTDGRSTFVDELFETDTARAIIGTGGGAAGGLPAAEPEAVSGGAGGSMGLEGLFGGMSDQKPSQQSVGVQSVQFSPLTQGPHSEVTGNIGLLMDVSMSLTVELGRTKMLIKDILGMGEGTIVELDKLAGEPVDLLVNGKLIAKGEVVVIDENFGVRVTDIISPMERISNLE